MTSFGNSKYILQITVDLHRVLNRDDMESSAQRFFVVYTCIFMEKNRMLCEIQTPLRNLLLSNIFSIANIIIHL